MHLENNSLKTSLKMSIFKDSNFGLSNHKFGNIDNTDLDNNSLYSAVLKGSIKEKKKFNSKLIHKCSNFKTEQNTSKSSKDLLSSEHSELQDPVSEENPKSKLKIFRKISDLMIKLFKGE